MKIRSLKRVFKVNKKDDVRALKGLDFDLPEEGIVFLLGKSGCGKTTLLNILGGLDRATSGEVIYKGRNLAALGQKELNEYRNGVCGFIFQEYNVIPELTVGENIAIAMQLQGEKDTAAHVAEVLKKVGLEGYENRKVTQLSGGQKQRVAIARALVKNSEIIFADEPTGALDSQTGESIFGLLKEISKDKLVVVVSHDREFAEKYADRIIELKDGEIISDSASACVTESGTLSLATARLPAKAVFKIGTADFRRTPVKLFFTALICVLAFTLFITSLALQGSDGDTIFANTLASGAVDEVSYTGRNERFEYAPLMDADCGYLENYFKTRVIKLTDCELSVEELGDDESGFLYYAGTLQSFAVVDEEVLNSFGFTLSGSLPKSAGEIALTKYMAEVLAFRAGITGIIGRELTIDGEIYTVCGLVDTDFDGAKYASLKTVTVEDVSTLGQEFVNYLNYSAHTAAYAFAPLSEGGGYCCALLPSGAVKARDISILNVLENGDAKYVLGCYLSAQISEVVGLTGDLKIILTALSAVLGVLAVGLFAYYIVQSVADKTRTIGILKALGCPGGEIIKIFIIEGLIIGVFAFALSLALGFAACGLISYLLANAFGLSITVVALGITDVAVLFFVTIPLSLICGTLAVLRVQKVNPIECLAAIN